MTHFRRVADSLLIAVGGCKGFQPGRLGMKRMAGQGLLGTPWSVVAPLEGVTQLQC